MRAALTVHGHPSLVKMALFDLFMEFEIFLGQMTFNDLKTHGEKFPKYESSCLKLAKKLVGV